MFRLIKLVVLGLIGYAVYEFFRGMTGTQAVRQMAQGGRGRGAGQGGAQQSEPHLGAGNMQFSGPGEGKHEDTEEATGTSTPHFVGRGVVQR